MRDLVPLWRRRSTSKLGLPRSQLSPLANEGHAPLRESARFFARIALSTTRSRLSAWPTRRKNNTRGISGRLGCVTPVAESVARCAYCACVVLGHVHADCAREHFT